MAMYRELDSAGKHEASLKGSVFRAGWRISPTAQLKWKQRGAACDIEELIDALSNDTWIGIERMESESILVHGDYNFEVK